MKKLLTATALAAMVATTAQAKEINLVCTDNENQTQEVMINTEIGKGATRFGSGNISSTANTYMVKSVFRTQGLLLTYQTDINRSDLSFYSVLKSPMPESFKGLPSAKDWKEIVSEYKGTCEVVDTSKNKI